jgi:methylenetetrahydrofolate--tRNA-(uracil-5-)-methyltransferase
MQNVTIIGAGLAGSECAWQLAMRGIAVTLCEMKPQKRSPAHIADTFAELVCSNSLRSDELANAVGLLKEEMRRFGSLIMQCADANKVGAGGALAVDRVKFSQSVTDAIRNEPLITVIDGEVTELPDGIVVIATGPLTSDALAQTIARRVTGGEEYLSFYDAAAPIVTFDSINMNKAFFASRYDKGDADYINCPMDKPQYDAFIAALTSAEEAEVHGFDDAGVFEGCMPVEVMARRGADTLRHGPLKPVGINVPEGHSLAEDGYRPYAVVQLRRDDAEGTLYNIVGFQTHLKFGEQKRVFTMIPGLEDAEFVRYGVMHRNTYINSPQLLDRYYRFREEPRLRFAGQITGVEGYVESTASGLLVGIETARELLGAAPLDLPPETAIGALAAYISSSVSGDFQPMNVNFGIIPPLDHRVKGKREKNFEISRRALEIIENVIENI